MEGTVYHGRHPSVAHFGPLFSYTELPMQDQEVAKASAELAGHMVAALPDGPELSAGLRKVLEARDCFLRAVRQE